MSRNIQYKKLTDICEIITGEWGTEINENSKNIVSIIRTTNFVNNGKIDIQNKELVRREMDENKIEQKKLKKGDIIIEKSGGSPNQPVGRVVFFNLNSNEIFLCNNFTSILRIKENINSKYIFYFLRNSYKNNKVLKFQNKTTGIINLKLQNYLNRSYVYLPELKIQNKVVNILDILESILEKNQNYLIYLKELTKSLFTRMFGSPENNEKKWRFCTLKDISLSKGEYGSNKPAVKFSNGYRYIRITDIDMNGSLKKEKVGVSDEEIEAQKYELKENDILFARSGATVGKNFFYNKKYGKCIFAGYLIRFQLNNKLILVKYLKYFLETDYYWNWIKACQNIVAQPNINAKQYGEDLKIMLPPMELQNKFAERIGKIEKLKFEIEKSIEETQKLYNSLISKYFDN